MGSKNVSAGFVSAYGDNTYVASATVTWDSNLKVTVSNVSCSSSGVSYKWRIRGRASDNDDTVYAGTDISNSFTATEGKTYIFQACVSGAGGVWGNSTDGSSNFTVTSDSGGDSGGGEEDNPTPTVLNITQGNGTILTVERIYSKHANYSDGNNKVYLSNGDTVYYDGDYFVITAEALDGYELDYYNHNGSQVPFELVNFESTDFWGNSCYSLSYEGYFASIKTTASVTSAVRIGNGSGFEQYLCYINDGSTWNKYTPYIYNGTSWDRYS